MQSYNTESNEGVLLTWCVSGAFTVPFVSFLFALNLMPSAVNLNMNTLIDAFVIYKTQKREKRKRNSFTHKKMSASLWIKITLMYNVTVPRFAEAMNSSISSSSESSMRGVKAYLWRLNWGLNDKRKEWTWTILFMWFIVMSYLWLLADGLHKNMMTSRMMENKNLQKASSTHSSIQSFAQKQIALSISHKPFSLWLPCKTILTDWQSASRNFFAVQPMKMMEAWGKNGQRFKTDVVVHSST